MSDTSVLQITEEVIDLTVSATDSISVDIISDNVALTVNNMAIPTQTSNATGIVFSGHTGMSSNTVDAAIKELADNQFRSNAQPTSATEGDTWYDLDDNQFKVYRETATNTFEWVPILLGDASGDSDTLDAGAF